MNHFLAIDLGASSGRAILFSTDGEHLTQRELSRFDNPIIHVCGHDHWDIYALYHAIINVLRQVAQEQITLTSIGIDTWGVDFVLIGADGSVLRNPYSYRDTHTRGVPDLYFAHVPAERVYQLTGIQVMDFNTLYQLYAMFLAGDSALAAADKILFMPDALNYLLTGQMATEYTIASTSNMLNPVTKQLEPELLNVCGLKPQHFATMVMPGTVIGHLSSDVQRLTGLGAVPVVAVASHDTASAVAAVPAQNERFAYLSSGTWSLMGVETGKAIIDERTRTENFTNEGGIQGTTRFLKNICGMWLIERCRQEWGDEAMEYERLIEQVQQETTFMSIINPDDPMFANPTSMIEAIQNYCRLTGQEVPVTQIQMAQCIFWSLAERYSQVMRLLQSFAPFTIERLHIIGGGSRNALLNQLTANTTGLTVEAGPAECTALGNVLMQARAEGIVADLWQMRRMVAANFPTVIYRPKS